MKDLIIGCIRNYTPSQVACWINSIKACGFEGEILVISFGVPQETIQFLESKRVKVLHVEPQGRHIVIERFLAIYSYLSTSNQYRCIIATDVRDVVFQCNPIDFCQSQADTHLDQDPYILLASENIVYKDEDWGRNNMQTSYPHLYDRFKNNIIFNAGVIIGDGDAFKDFCLHIYHLSLLGQDPQPDQAAMNILIRTYPHKLTTKLVTQNEGMVMNHGTDLEKYKGKLIEESPIIKEDGLVICPGTKEPFYIIHQYDRVPGLKEQIEKRFGSTD